jgi:hypothetical protein
MIDRNAEIQRNKMEVLTRRKDELLREIAAAEAQLAGLTVEYDREVKFRRLEAIFVPTSTDSRTENERGGERRIRRGEFRVGFVAGLSFSLVIGILVVLTFRHGEVEERQRAAAASGAVRR